MSKDKDLKDLQREIHNLSLAGNTNSQRITGIEKSIEEIKEGQKEISDEIKATYVTNHRFEPVKLIAYGMAGGVLLCVLGAILGMVVATPKTYVSIEKTYAKPTTEILHEKDSNKD